LKKILEIDDLKIKICENVYPPSEDTFLLIDALKKYNVKRKKILEIGTGTGIIAIYLAKRGAKVYATDIKKEAVQCAKENAKINKVKIETIQSNLFENIKEKNFDIIIFNPPYLPPNKEQDKYLTEKDKLDIIGGENGVETTIKFVKKVKKYLNKKGKAIIIQSTLANLEKLNKTIKENNLKTKIIAKKRYFFEEIQAIEIHQ